MSDTTSKSFERASSALTQAPMCSTMMSTSVVVNIWLDTSLAKVHVVVSVFAPGASVFVFQASDDRWSRARLKSRVPELCFSSQVMLFLHSACASATPYISLQYCIAHNGNPSPLYAGSLIDCAPFKRA